ATQQPSQQWQWPRRDKPMGTGGSAGGGGDRLARLNEVPRPPSVEAGGPPPVDVNEDVKFRVHRRLIQELETTRLAQMPKNEAREAVDVGARQILQQEAPGVFGLARDELIAAIVDEVLGLGPIEPLLRDSSITEI